MKLLKYYMCVVLEGLDIIIVSTLPPKSLHIPNVYVVKHACYSELWEGQGEGRCKLGSFLTKL